MSREESRVRASISRLRDDRSCDSRDVSDLSGYRRPVLRRPAALALALLLSVPPLMGGVLVAPADAATGARVRATPQVELTSWSSYADLKAGRRTGLKLGRGQVS